jgi:allantoicase
VTLVPQSLLKGNSRNYFASIATTVPVVSVKLNNFPDGGIARYGVLPSVQSLRILSVGARSDSPMRAGLLHCR